MGKNERASKMKIQQIAHKELWVSEDKPQLFIGRVKGNICTGKVKPVTVEFVRESTKHALEFLCEIAGEDKANVPELSQVALKKHDIVYELIVTNNSTMCWRKKIGLNAVYEGLTNKEKEFVIESAQTVLEAVRKDSEEGPNNDTLSELKEVVLKFYCTPLEILNEAAAIKRLMKRGETILGVKKIPL
jgi:hypothetical protein